MDHNTNFTFNPRRYEDHLSPFGKKVLSTLVHKWKSDLSHARNTFQQRFSSSIQNRRVLQDEGSFTRLPPPLIEKEIHKTANDFYDGSSLDLNLIERNLPQVPSTLELVQAVDTSDKITGIDSINVPAHDLINPVVNGHTVLNLTKKGSATTAADLPATNSTVDDSTVDDIDWNNMFDTKLFPEEIITNAKVVLKQTETPVQNKFNVKFHREMVKKANETKTIYPQLKSDKETSTLKRKNKPITDVIPKKVKKVSEVNKNSFRKQKYTKAVKNWLDVNSINLVEKDEVSYKSSEPYHTIEQNKVISEKVKKKSTTKIIQTQLANKDGIMKYEKPKLDKAKKYETDNCKTKESDKNNENVVVKNKAKNEHIMHTKKDKCKDKMNNPKFVVPIKSQIPVKDVKFKVVTINENNIRDHTDALSCIRNEEIVAVLVYSNGFSQLNNHHTADTCDPEGFIVNIHNNFLYFQGSHNKVILQALFENNRIVCYEGKVLLIYFKSKLDLDIHNFEMIDAKIGGSLLDPDNPPENFSDLQKLVSFTPQYTIATECVLQKTAWYATLLKECVSKLASLLMQEDKLWNLFVDIEMKLLPIIAEMERRGISIDLQKLKSMEEILVTKMKSVELGCYKAAGKTFQINSHVQVRALIYDELQLDAKCNVKIRQTLSKGAKSTSESMLRSLVSVHSLPKLILEYRHLHKAYATFVAGIAEHGKDGIVRPTWVQTAAATGRIASNNPNLQAIPKAPFSPILFPEPQDDARESAPAEVLRFRSVYESRPGYSLVAADFRHLECRVLALVAGDARLQAALRAPDLFRDLAATWLNKPESEVSGAERERTKRVVYASVYGAGVRKLMDILDLGYDQALAITASFNRTFPGLKRFARGAVRACAARGRLATPRGRARRLPHVRAARPALRARARRQAVNFLVQGSAADLCKQAMVVTERRLRACRPPVDGALLLQIHDELVWELRDSHVRTAAVLIKEAMEGCGYESGMAAALPVSISTGKNWGEMKEYQIDVPRQ